jgi:hypothetical protein
MNTLVCKLLLALFIQQTAAGTSNMFCSIEKYTQTLKGKVCHQCTSYLINDVRPPTKHTVYKG